MNKRYLTDAIFHLISPNRQNQQFFLGLTKMPMQFLEVYFNAQIPYEIKLNLTYLAHNRRRQTWCGY